MAYLLSVDREHHGSFYLANADAPSARAPCDRDALSVAFSWPHHGFGSCHDGQAKGKESRALVFTRIYSARWVLPGLYPGLTSRCGIARSHFTPRRKGRIQCGKHGASGAAADLTNRWSQLTKLNPTISFCSVAICLRKRQCCWSDFIRRELHFTLNPELLLLILSRQFSSISVWTQRAPTKSLRFIATFSAMDLRIMLRLSFVIAATNGMFDVRCPMFDLAEQPCCHCSRVDGVPPAAYNPR